MADRYFVETPIGTDRVRLAGPEAHHLIHVMRAKPGAEVWLFDGSGAEFRARVENISRSEAEMVILQRQATDREPRREVTLAVALPKGDRQRWLVEKCVELGVARLVPLETERSVAQPTAGTLSKLRRAVVEASKQCGRNRLMEITAPACWPECPIPSADMPRWLAHPGAETALSWRLLSQGVGGAAQVVAAIGPEGGFSDTELRQAAAAGWQPIGLGPRILRVETAAVLLAGILTLDS